METRYQEIADSTEAEVLKMVSSTSWIPLKTQKGIVISWQKSPHFNGSMYKFSCVVDVPCNVVYNVLKPPKTAQERLSWDKSIADYRRLVTFHEDLFIALITLPSILMGVISSREFLDLFQFKVIQADDVTSHWVFAKSVEYDSHPVTAERIRAHTYPSGYSATPLQSDKTRVDFYINIDTGGMLPRSLVEANLPSQQIKYIESLKKEAIKRWKG